MQHIEESFAGCAGITIFWQAWVPDSASSTKAVVVVAHGYGEHSGRYANVVEALVPQGFAVYIPDHRGHGKSGGHRALIDRYQYFLDDLDRVFARAARDHPGLPVFLVGHSMGGNIALASALGNQGRLSGLVLSGPAVTNHGLPKPLMIMAKIVGRLNPKAATKQLSAEGVSSDPAVVAAYVNDPLVFHGKMPAGTAKALIETSESFQARLPSLGVPLLVVHGSADTVVSVESGKTAYTLAGSKDKTLNVYDGLAHEVFNEPERAKVLNDVSAWLNAHC